MEAYQQCRITFKTTFTSTYDRKSLTRVHHTYKLKTSGDNAIVPNEHFQKEWKI